MIYLSQSWPNEICKGMSSAAVTPANSFRLPSLHHNSFAAVSPQLVGEDRPTSCSVLELGGLLVRCFILFIVIRSMAGATYLKTELLLQLKPRQI